MLHHALALVVAVYSGVKLPRMILSRAALE